LPRVSGLVPNVKLNGNGAPRTSQQTVKTS
jgi:hypothetical protein